MKKLGLDYTAQTLAPLQNFKDFTYMELSGVFSLVSLFIWQVVIMPRNHLKLCTHHGIIAFSLQNLTKSPDTAKRTEPLFFYQKT